MTVLHIANDYLGSTVYKELYGALSTNGLEQLVYCPVRNRTINKAEEQKGINLPYKVCFSPPLRGIHKLMFKTKIRFLTNDISDQINLTKVNIIHATTLFSDGAIAYNIFKKIGTPYVVTVRNTDLNFFLKYMVHLRQLGLTILLNATKIVFISPVYLERFSNHPYIKKHVKSFEHKMVLIPNGINGFWIDNIRETRNTLSNPVQLLYIGKFSKGKNVFSLINAVKHLVADQHQYQLHIVGGGGDDSRRVMNLIEGNGFIKYYGQVFDKNILLNIMRTSHVFVMPSKRETFGLVYLEALSQGLVLVYTRGEGIDGLYGKEIGESVNPNDLESIKNAILKITRNYKKYFFDTEKVRKNHDWDHIASAHLNLYEDSLYST